MKLKHWRSLALRFMRARKLRSVLVVAGIALGAVLLTAVLTLGETLNAGVQQHIREEYGTHNAIVGKRTFAPMEPEMVKTIAALPQLRWQVPVINHEVSSIRTPVAVYMGVGPFPPGESGLFIAQGRYPRAGEVTLTKAIADRLGVTIGQSVTLPFPAGDRTLVVAGLVTTTGLPPTAYCDYEWLRSELRVAGPSMLLVGLAPGATTTVFAARVTERFPDLAVEGRGESGQMRQRLDTFGVLGGILSVGALFTSLYLVLGAFGVTVQERVHELAMIRAIGGRRRQVVRLLVTEVAVLGVIGAAFGCLAGVGAAWAAASVVSRVFQVPVHPLVVPVPALGAVFVVTLVTALVGAWSVVRSAGRIAPLAAMRPDAVQEARHRKAGGLLSLLLLIGSVAAAAAAWAPGLSQVVQFGLACLSAGLLLLGALVGLGRVLPWMTAVCARLLSPWLHVQTMIGQRNIARQVERATRMSGMMLLGIAVLLALASTTQTEDRSYRENLPYWFPTEGKISAAWGIKVGYDDAFVKHLAAIEGVDAVYPEGAEFDAVLAGYDEKRMSPERLTVARQRHEPPGRVTVQFTDMHRLAEVWRFGKVEGTLTGGVVISRRLAEQIGLKSGERLAMQRADGGQKMAFAVVGLVENAPGSGLVIDRSLMPDSVPSHYREALVKVNPQADRERVRDAVNQQLKNGYAAFSYEDMTDIIKWTEQNTRQSKLMVGMTGMLMLVAAAVGFANVVIASMHERRREMAMVRAVGAKARQLFGLVAVEALLLGMASSLVGVGTGVLMILLYQLPAMRSGAGWPVVPLEVVIPALVAGPALAVLATIAPVLAIARQPLIATLKEE